MAFFHETCARDIVFAARRTAEGPIALGFHTWDIDRFGERELLPYHVKMSLEGMPQHAWCQEVAKKVLCDEATIRHVEEDIVRQFDQRLF
jgi:hypothetical protein